MAANTVNTVNTVILAKAGIQYADGGTGSIARRALLEAASQCNRWFAVHKTGYWIPACAGMTDSALQLSDHVARCLCG